MPTLARNNKSRPRRNHSLKAKCIAAAASLALVAVCAAQDHPSNEQEKQAFQRVCSSCHPAEAATAGRKTQAQWEETIGKMIDDKGAKGSDEDFGMAFDYLVRNYGRVNVNRATRLELQSVLGLSAEDANKILDYRRANGEYTDLASLAAVPGLPADKLKQHEDAISF